jgi:hypothetical protein
VKRFRVFQRRLGKEISFCGTFRRANAFVV